MIYFTPAMAFILCMAGLILVAGTFGTMLAVSLSIGVGTLIPALVLVS